MGRYDECVKLAEELGKREEGELRQVLDPYIANAPTFADYPYSRSPQHPCQQLWSYMGRIPRDLPRPSVFETHDLERAASVYAVSETRPDVEEGCGEEWCREDHQRGSSEGVVCRATGC